MKVLSKLKKHPFSAAFLSIVLLLSSCDQSETSKSEAKQKEMTEQDSLVKDSSKTKEMVLDDMHDIIDRDTDEVLDREFDVVKLKFESIYKTIAPLNLSSIKIKFDNLLVSLFTGIKNKTDSGLVFHYGMSDNGKEIYYIISKGGQDSNMKATYLPFSKTEINHTDSGYVLLRRNSLSKYRIIPTDSLCYFKQNYANTMQRKDDLTGDYNTISKDKDHPHFVYHQGSELNLFYEAYKGEASQLYLYIYQGCDDPNGAIRKYHLPILRFGNDSIVFPIDDDTTRTPKYTGKALDAGHLCPPKCGTQINYSCP